MTRGKLIVVIILLLLLGVGLYYIGIFNIGNSLSGSSPFSEQTKETTGSSELVATVTRVETVKDDFLFIVYVDKAEYGFDEPIVVRFNFTYIGEIPLKATVPHSYEQFRIRVWNETDSNVGEAPLAFLRLPQNVPIGHGWSMLGTLIISSYEQSHPSYGSSTPPIFGFTPGSMYYIQGATGLGLISGDNYRELSITAPPLAVLILEIENT